MSRRAAFAVIAILIVAAFLFQAVFQGRHGARNSAPPHLWANALRQPKSSEPSIAQWFSIVPATRLVPNSRTALGTNGRRVRKFASASLAPLALTLSTRELFHGALLGAVVAGVPAASVPAGQQMLADLNTTRAQRRLPLLKLDRRLSQIALAHARDMVQHGFFAHASSNGDSPFDRMREARITYIWAGENLAESPDEPTAYGALLNSREHFANMVQRHYSKVGIAVVQGPDGEMFFVEDFTN